jgi:hypothetical protein
MSSVMGSMNDEPFAMQYHIEIKRTRPDRRYVTHQIGRGQPEVKWWVPLTRAAGVRLGVTAAGA